MGNHPNFPQILLFVCRNMVSKPRAFESHEELRSKENPNANPKSQISKPKSLIPKKSPPRFEPKILDGKKIPPKFGKKKIQNHIRKKKSKKREATYMVRKEAIDSHDPNKKMRQPNEEDPSRKQQPIIMRSKSSRS